MLLITDDHATAIGQISSALAIIQHAAENKEPYCVNKVGIDQILKRCNISAEKLREFYATHCVTPHPPTPPARTEQVGQAEPIGEPQKPRKLNPLDDFSVSDPLDGISFS